MEYLEAGIREYVERIHQSVGGASTASDIQALRWATEQKHSVWKKPRPKEISTLDWWVGLPGREVPIRLYRREGLSRPPLLLHIHGGGFVASSYDTHDTISWGLAQATDALVVSINYRRAPENPFPAAIDDCFEVLKWLVRHEEWLDGDSSRIAVYGDSAGGCLATALTMLARDRGGPDIVFQALAYPCLDPSAANRHGKDLDPMLSRASMRYFWSAYLPGNEDTSDPIAAPIRATNLKGLPPAYVVTGEFDPLLDEGRQYVKMLVKEGVIAEFKEAKGLIHSFLRARFVSDTAKFEFEALAEKIRCALSNP